MVRVVVAGVVARPSGGDRSAGSGAGELPPPRVELKENYPNPFFPATTIPFEIFPGGLRGGHQPVVSLKIYNVLVQVVAIPVLADGSVERVDSLRLRCGQYRAYWDGKYLDGRREARRASTTTSLAWTASGLPGR